MLIPKRHRRMATRIPQLPVIIRKPMATQREPRDAGHKAACWCWACAVIEVAWIGALVWLVARMV